MKQLVLILMLGLAASLGLFPVPGGAQEGQVKIIAPPPKALRPPELVTPGQPPEITRPREADFRPDDIRTRHDPALIAPFTTTVRTGPNTAVHFGLSGWTSPPGRGDLLRDHHAGWFSLGFTFIWDVPVPREPGKPETSSAGPPALR